MPYAQHGSARLRWEQDGTGDALVLIMGLGGSAAAWHRLLPHLVPHAWCITLDNRGTGRSSPVTGPLTMRDLVGDVLAVMDDAGVRRAHVLGLSLGGMVAQQLALDHRGRVASLVLGCTTAHALGGQPPWRLLGASALRPLLGPQRSWELLAPAMYSARTRREHPERIQQDLAVRDSDPVHPATVGAQLAAAALHDVRGRLGELAGLPVTVVHGEEDGTMDPARARELAAGIPGARLVMIPACGHMLTTDAEEVVAQAVLAHLWAAGASPP